MCTAHRDKTVLVVDDSEDVRELLGEVLRTAGYRVREAENGREALEQLDEMPCPPCVLLLDLMMPVMTGSELLVALRERHRFASLPVVVISAGGQPAQAPDAKQFMRKPVDPKTLLAVVRGVCGE